MVRLVALLVVGLCALAAIPAYAQTGSPHFTIVVTGPAYAHVGDEVTYRYDVTVDTDRGATFVMSWPNHMVYVRSRLIEGVAEPVVTPIERWWNTYSHHAVIDVVLRMGEELMGEAWAVGAYITGTEVAEFIDSSPFYTTVFAQGTALPSTGVH